MIVLDSSVLVAIIKGGQDAAGLLDLLAIEECAMGAPTRVETRAWCTINLATRSSRWLEDFIEAGSEPAPGSVMLKHASFSPLQRGTSHFSFCCSVPCWMMQVMGATWDASTSTCADSTRPISSRAMM